MAFDGLVTYAVAQELKNKIELGKIEKVYQPEADELVFNVHSRTGNVKLFMSTGSSHSRIHFVEETPVNPPAPLAFCMLLRKHLQGGRITEIKQYESERIIEIYFESLNELGFTVSKKLVVEIMGKHSNVTLVDLETGKIVDAIKRVSFDVNRVRQILPGMIYQYPPAQDKVPFKDAVEADFEGQDSAKSILSRIGGISPAFAEELFRLDSAEERYAFLRSTIERIENLELEPRVYYDESGAPQEFYIFPLKEYEESVGSGVVVQEFETISQALECYFMKKESSNQGRQKSHDLIRSVSQTLDKMYLKKKRLNEDLIKAENSDELRLYGELLQANLHLVKPGMKSVKVVNYYDGSEVEIPLDVKTSAQKNMQTYFKKYGKAKTAIKEKQTQLEENEQEISYLESVLQYLENTDDVLEIEALRQELVETGYIKRRKQQGGFKDKKQKFNPVRYTLSNGMVALVGRNNVENDHLTLKTAGKHDVWFHTKDIPGSHVILQTEGAVVDELDADTIYEAAAIAAYHSKARTSENVAVDYVPVRYVKKPAGAKPGMVIFTNNRTVWINPGLPKEEHKDDN